MKKFFKRIFRKPAILQVTIWAKRTYRQGVDAAERQHRITGTTIYLAADSWHPDRLVTYDRFRFRAEKKVYGMSARLLTMHTLRRGCYYHTCDSQGKNGMAPEEVERRRRAFIKERIRLSGLA